MWSNQLLSLGFWWTQPDDCRILVFYIGKIHMVLQSLGSMLWVWLWMKDWTNRYSMPMNHVSQRIMKPPLLSLSFSFSLSLSLLNIEQIQQCSSDDINHFRCWSLTRITSVCLTRWNTSIIQDILQVKWSAYCIQGLNGARPNYSLCVILSC